MSEQSKLFTVGSEARRCLWRAYQILFERSEIKGKINSEQANTEGDEPEVDEPTNQADSPTSAETNGEAG